MRDVAHDLVNQRLRRHLRFADRARCRSIDQWWQDFDKADVKATQLPPQRHRKGAQASLRLKFALSNSANH
jgi:hypothetical protein